MGGEAGDRRRQRSRSHMIGGIAPRTGRS
jgi:hypothetical protein